MAQQFKAFKIAHQFTLPGGRCYKRSDFYQSRSQSEEETLTKAQFAIELEEGAAPQQPPARTVTEAKVAAAKAPAHEPEHETEQSPDWSFMTKTAMRVWLDQAGVALPNVRAPKPAYENLCADAWTAGRRPHPLYGFPGGQEPSPGMAGATNATDPQVFAAAIEAAHAGGFDVPEGCPDALEELTAAQESETDVPSHQDGQEAASGAAGEPVSADPAGTSSPINAAPVDAETASPVAADSE